MARGGRKDTLILIDGNSLPQQAATNLVTAFESEYGAGNYEHINIAVGGQTWTDMISNINEKVVSRLSPYRRVILIAHEIRNEIAVNLATPATVLSLTQSYFSTVKSKVSTTNTICVLTSASMVGGGDTNILTDVPLANALISAETAGNIDNKIDLYNYDSFDTPTAQPPFHTDGVHYATGVTGRGLYAGFVAAQTKLIYD